MVTSTRGNGPESLAAWRYLVPGPGRRVGVVGDLDPTHRERLLETFEEVAVADADSEFDGLLVLAGQRVPPYAGAHRRRGGWVVCLHDHPLLRGRPGETYGVYPSLDSPVLMLPVAHLGAGLSLYNTSRPVLRRIIQRVANSPLSAGLRLMGGRVTVRGGDPTARLVPAEHHVAVATGTPSAYHKATVLLLSPTGAIDGYGKLSGRDITKGILQIEAQRLEELAGLDLQHLQVPRLLRKLEWGRELGHVQAGPEESLGPWQDGLSDALIGALAEIFERTETQCRLADSHFWKELIGWADAVSPYLEPEWKTLIADTIAQCLDEAPQASERMGLCHGDFIEWNIKGKGATVFIYDWEQSVHQAPPFHDLLNWAIFTHHHIRGDDSSIVALIEDGASEFAGGLSALEARLDLQYERRHLRLCALRTALYHLRSRLPGNELGLPQHQLPLGILQGVLTSL